MTNSFIPRIHKDGWIFFSISFVLSIGLFYICEILGFLGFLVTGWVLYFFRHPWRVTPRKEGVIVSPADGMVQRITEAAPPAELNLPKGKWTRVSIFLNVFNVHVNRIPVQGTIDQAVYHKGKFFNASLDKASEHNERQTLCVKTDQGQLIPFVQIAGLIARRIRCDVEPGDSVKAGQYFGLIRFGSRMDVFLPEGIKPLVLEGQRTIAGETILANLMGPQEAYEGNHQ